METLPSAIAEALRSRRDQAFAERFGAPGWTYTSSSRMLGRAGALARAISESGVAPGDRVALISTNRVDWLAADFGILFAGCVVVPIFATLALDQVEYIFNDAEPKLAFVETEADAKRIRVACPSAPRLIAFDGTGPDTLSAFEGPEDPAFVAPEAADPEALAVLIYTSGTTGDPKGVMLSHRNLLSNARAATEYLPDSVKAAGTPVLTILPFAHIFEHMTMLIFVLDRSQVHITSADHLVADLKAVRPIVMTLVPRIFELVLAGIVKRAKAEGGIKSTLVPWALEVGRAYAVATENGAKAPPALELQTAIARRLVLAKLKQQIGLDRLRFFVSGSASLHRDITLTFAGMGVPVAEGYGLTEASPVVTSNPVTAIKYGTVGLPLPGVEIKLGADGEIFVRGPNVMMGYYNLPSEKPVSSDGWLATGDVGQIDADGYLSITDRKKELIKTTAGKWVAPSRVESALKRSLYVRQCFVIGDGRPFPIALVTPDWDVLRRELGLAQSASTAAISIRSDVRDVLLREVAARSADLASFEAIRCIAVLPHDLTIEAGELSPTFKVKRRVVEKKYARLIESAYASPGLARRS